MSEHQVVVVFDVSAPDLLAAGRQVAEALVFGDTRPHRRAFEQQLRAAGVESWWMPEEPLRSEVDHNDNAPGHLVFDERVST